MVALANRVRVNTATTGTGTVTLGAATSASFFTFAEGGITNGQTVAYLIEEALDFEFGTGVYTSAGTTMTRATVIGSKIGGTAGTSKMNLAGTAVVSIVALKDHFIYDGNANTTAVVNVGSIELGAATDTTVARTAAGRATIEAKPVNTYTYSATAPTSPLEGDQWCDSDDLTLYTYVNDGDSSQWAQLNPPGVNLLDASGNAVLPYGTTAQATSNIYNVTSTPIVQVHTTGTNSNNNGAFRWNNNSTSPAGLTLSFSRGTSVGTHTIVQQNDDLGHISFNGSDGVDFETAAAILCECDGTPGSDDMPGRLSFWTTLDGGVVTSERMRIDNAGRVFIGGATGYINVCNAYSNDNPNNYFNIYGNEFTANATIVSWNAADSGPAELILGSCSRNATVGTFTVVQSGDSLGSIGFVGSDGTNFETAARITCKVDGTPGADDMPGRIEFFTTRDGASLPELKLTIPQDGGLKFPATQLPSADSNTLDDYEEGSFTPTITTSGVAPTTLTYTRQQGAYTKVGNKVTVTIFLKINAFTLGAGTGVISVSAFPFSNNASTFAGYTGYTLGVDWPSTAGPVVFFQSTSSTSATVNIAIDDGNPAGIALSGLAASDEINLFGSYFV